VNVFFFVVVVVSYISYNLENGVILLIFKV